MIHEVDEALRALVRAEAVGEGADVDVVFEAPTRDWAARRNTPTVNLYLYDIREDMRRRSRGRRNIYDEQGRVTARTLPPRYFKLSYLISAWTQRPEDEHRLLSALLACFLRHDALPAAGLGPELAGTGLPVPVSIALPPPEDRAFADVWSALGGELKPSLDVVVSAPVATAPVWDAGPPVEDGLVVDLSDVAAGAGPGPGAPSGSGGGGGSPGADEGPGGPGAGAGAGGSGAGVPRARGPRTRRRG
ncbi:DUF4255 domain-containing protein [Streptomyces sp. NPDC093225]|uniref:DUF4255 domain-containing protein n=1 Tax=Streptomyces sp. NPDC093225 TaxID=3366034 RepID=UPI0037FD3367